MVMKKSKPCLKPFHDWWDVDADDMYTLTVCKKCGIYWDYEELIWWDKLIFLFEERMEEKRYAQWRNQYWEPPF